MRATFQRPTVSVSEVVPGVRRYDLSSRWSRALGMTVSVYQLGDLLVDTGFAHAREVLLGALPREGVRAIACTHHHEDHTAGAGALRRRYGCPVYLHRPELRWIENVDSLPSYRQWWWGWPEDYDAEPFPDVVEGERHRLVAVPTPGHSATHVVLLEEHTGALFTGDLYVSKGASAIMAHEDPLELARSLRRAADLEPRWMLTGHGLALERPAEALRLKAERIEQAAARVLDLRDRGVPTRRIVTEVFGRPTGRERFSRYMTVGEFSQGNFVRAVLRNGR